MSWSIATLLTISLIWSLSFIVLPLLGFKNVYIANTHKRSYCC
jgi:hypothetical protein